MLWSAAIVARSRRQSSWLAKHPVCFRCEFHHRPNLPHLSHLHRLLELRAAGAAKRLGLFEFAAETAGTGTDNIDLKLTPPERRGGYQRDHRQLFLRQQQSVHVHADLQQSVREIRWQNDSCAPTWIFGKSRGSAFDSCTVVQLTICWATIRSGQRRTNFAEAANFSAEVDGTPGNNDMPMRFVWRTSADGTQIPAENLRLTTAAILSYNSSMAPGWRIDNDAVYVHQHTGFGIYVGSGAPTVSAAQGSLYLRSDGSSNVTRMYVNTNGSTTWTAVNTVA